MPHTFRGGSFRPYAASSDIIAIRVFPSLSSCRLALLSAAAASLLVCCGRIGFEAQPSDSGAPGSNAVDAGAGSIVDANSAFAVDASSIDAAPSFAEPVRLRGLDSCQGATSTVTIAGATIAAGSVLIVHAIQSFNTNKISVVDSRGNSYVLLEAQGQIGQHLDVLQATITTPLVAGDTITATFENASDNALVVTEIKGVASTAFSTQSSFAPDSIIVVDYTDPSTGIMLCVGGIRGGSVDMLGSWTQLINAAQDCGGGGAGQTTFAYWAPAGQNAPPSCQATLIAGTGFSKWVAAVIGFEP